MSFVKGFSNVFQFSTLLFFCVITGLVLFFMLFYFQAVLIFNDTGSVLNWLSLFSWSSPGSYPNSLLGAYGSGY